MAEMAGKLSPLLALVLFGFILKKKNYFEEATYSRMLHFVLNVAIPCMLFSTFIEMEMNPQYLIMSVFFFFYMVLALALGFAVAKLRRIPHRFFPFMLTSFGFGTLGLPLYTTIFGVEKAKYIAILGVGHEVFIAAIFLPLAIVYLSGQKFELKNSIKLLKNPFLIMVGLAMLIRGFGLTHLLTDNPLGMGIYGAISRIGGMTLVLTLILIGYRIEFSKKGQFRTSLYYVGLRFLVTIGLGLLLRVLIADKLMGYDPYFIHAYNMLMVQHLPMSLTALVGEYGTKEEHLLINNAFVINLVGGFILFFLYTLWFVK